MVYENNWHYNVPHGSEVYIFCEWVNLYIRVRPRFFDQVRHETMYASSGNKTYQNYEQSRQKLGTILEYKVS